MLITMHMDMEAMVLDTDFILMDMAIILDTQPLDIVMVLDTDMVMDTTDKPESQKKQLINSKTNGMFLLLKLTLIFHSVNDPLFRSGGTIFTFYKSFKHTVILPPFISGRKE